MKQYGTFIFDSYAFDPKKGRITLKYSLDDKVHFTEILNLPAAHFSLLTSHSSEHLNAALFALHIIAGISYYKTCCPKQIEVRSGALTEEQARFWNEVYENGLGEFFYRNNIDFQDLIRFPAQSVETPYYGVSTNEKRITNNNTHRILVPIGCGKDSIVTLELLRSAGFDCTLLRMGKHPLADEIARRTNLPLLTIERTLPPALLKLNREGALNGHVPITAYLSFLATFVAILGSFDAVVMSNERSANEGNILFRGKEVNHQWSKSLSFEKMLQEYVRACIAPDLQYFSLLRPLSELHIAKLFIQHPGYFECTTSCNVNWKIEEMKRKVLAGKVRSPKQRKASWCGVCPKCAFVFSLYAAFLPKDTVTHIFGSNLYDNTSLLPVYRALLGIEGMKPFECVGTGEETKAAFLLIRERGEFTDSAVMQMFLRECLPTITDAQALIERTLTPCTDHVIPPEYAGLLSSQILNPHTS